LLLSSELSYLAEDVNMADEKINDTVRSSSETKGGDAATVPAQQVTMTKDEYHLASLGYKQVFSRGLGMVENWAATFTTMNFVNGLPILFGWVMSTGGPQAALANWTMVGGLSFFVSLSMAEIAASLPTCGGIYFWSYKLGGPEWGPFLAWMTAWWNWAGWLTVIPGFTQGNTNFLLAALQIMYPDNDLWDKPWFGWILSSIAIIVCTIPNIASEKILKLMLRTTIISFGILMSFYWIYFPIKASGHFQPASILTTFHNGINDGSGKQASDAYCWIIGLLYGAWDFYGYDAATHLAEETKDAQIVVARGMWLGTLCTWLLSVPTLILILMCMPSFESIINGSYANNWAVYLVELLGPKGAVAFLSFAYLDGLLGAMVCLLSTQRITYAIARDDILPFSGLFKKVNPRTRLPVNAALLCAVLSIAINAAVIGSEVAFGALTATATIATNVSYLIPILARQTVGRKYFEPAKWNLGRFSPVVATVACLYVCFLFIVLLLPQVYPVSAVSTCCMC